MNLISTLMPGACWLTSSKNIAPANCSPPAPLGPSKCPIPLHELIQTVKGEAGLTNRLQASSSELLARSYFLQSKADLRGALAAARGAIRMAPQSGFARARLAELEFSFGHRPAALAELDL